MLKRTVSGMTLTLLLVSMLTLAFNIQPVRADPKTWTVDDDGSADFSSIQEAINAASPGSTIYVRAGTYYENVVVNKSVSLVGEHPATAIVDGGRVGNVVEVAANHVLIANFTIRNSGISWGNSGISLSDYKNTKIHNNNIMNNGFGINIDYSPDNTISGNNITNNYYWGIRLWYSLNNTINGNNITDNYDYYWGIRVWSSSSNTINGNNITDKYYWGIVLYDCSNNTINGNYISITGTGIRLWFASNNRIYHNNFVNNIRQVHSEGSINTWDDGYPSGGNYWSDYEEIYPDAEELDGSGIWDTPYIIDVDNQDRYPLMKPYAFGRVPEVPEWQRLDTPFSDMLHGGPLCVAIDPLNPQIVYVGIKWGPAPRHIRIGGVYRSEDGGETWAYKGQGFLHPYKFWKRIPSIGALAIDPINTEIIYAASISGEGMWKSNDRGETWTQINNGLPRLWRWFGGYPAFTALAVSTSSPNVLYIGSGSANLPGIFKSVDGGESWSNVYVVENIMEEFVQVHSIVIDSTSPDIVYAAIEINGVGTIIKSADGGSSWATLATLPAQTLAISPISPQRLYAGATDGNVYESTDAGKTWRRKEVTDHPITALVISQVMPDWIFAGTGKTIERCGGSGIYASFDNGQNWRAVNGGLDTMDAACGRLDPTGIYVPINCLATSGISSIRMFATTDKGIYRITINLS